LSAAVAALSFSFNAFSIRPDISWSLIALISFLVFVAFVFWGWYGAELRARRLEYARPSVVFNGYSPEESMLTPMNKRAFFTRIEFVNNVAYPTGDNSTAHALIAQIKVINNNGQEVDAWEGRWANTDPPISTGDIWLKNRIELPANNQLAILDIGFRFEGEKEFIGWDNRHYFNLDKRVPLKPGLYTLETTLGGSNMEIREFRFVLTIPDTPQSDDNNPLIEFLEAKTLQELTSS